MNQNQKILVLGFMKLVLTKAVDLDKLEKDRGYPILKDPKYSIDYTPWFQSQTQQHGA